MHSDRRCAVIAVAFQPDRDAIALALSASGFGEIISVRDGMSALKCVQKRMTDLLIADVVLPGLDGPSLAERIGRMRLNVYPAVILVKPKGMPVRGCAEVVLEKPVRPEELNDALKGLNPGNRLVPEEKQRQLKNLLDSIGVPEHPGREYLESAALLARQDARYLNSLTTKLYPAVAEAFGVNGRQVERAIRHAIDTAWRSGEIEAQYEIFGDTIDARRGSPTCGEMIARIADILRWEGNA